MAKSVHDKLALDTHRMDVYLTGLQAEIEAKLRRVAKFREQMQKIDALGRKTDKPARERAARALIAQVKDMLATNRAVRDMLQELRAAVEAVLEDVRE